MANHEVIQNVNSDISQEDLEQLKTGFEVFNEITRGEKSTDKAKVSLSIPSTVSSSLCLTSTLLFLMVY